MDNFALLVPACVLVGALIFAFAVYCSLCLMGRTPRVAGVKHNQAFGPFLARFLAWLLGPVERALVGRVSPNVITALSLAMCALTGVAVAVGRPGEAVWTYAIAGILDVLDGRLARRAGRETDSGALFDSVCDRWGELCVFAGYAWFLRDTTWLLAAMFASAGSMMVSYTRARAESLGVACAGGIMQRAERIVVTALGTLVAAWFGADPATADHVVPILGVTMLIVGATATGTALSRWLAAHRTLAQRVTVVAVADPEPSAPYVPAKLRQENEMTNELSSASR